MHKSDHLKEQVKSKIQERDRLEASIQECSARLEASGVGMKSKLVDSQGFPRADIDVPAVRADRQQIAMLSNDYKAVMSTIEQLMHELHAEVKKASPSAADKATDTATQPAARTAATNAAALPQLPFAVVDEVSTSSPAEEAGAMVGDQLISFANITRQTPNTMQAVAAALQAHEDKGVLAKVLRRGSTVELHLTPHKWEGRGLLGCHLRPLT